MWKDPFHLREDDEKIFGLEVPYLSAIGALMYLANYTWPDIAFSVNLLTRYSSAQLEGIVMGSNMFYTIFVEQLTWDYFIQKVQIHD